MNFFKVASNIQFSLFQVVKVNTAVCNTENVST